MTIRERYLANVLALVPSSPEAPISAKDVHERLGYGSLSTVRKALAVLASQNKFIIVPESTKGGDWRNLYWRTDRVIR